MAGHSRGVLNPGHMPHQRLDDTLAAEVSALRVTRDHVLGTGTHVVGIQNSEDRSASWLELESGDEVEAPVQVSGTADVFEGTAACFYGLETVR